MAHDFTRNIKHLTTEQISDNFLNNFTDTNDIVSDDKHNYIKEPDEKFHCLTDNIKTIENTDVNDENNLLLVTNENETENKATLQVLHDMKKENRLTSTNDSISIISQVENINHFTNIKVNEIWLNQHIQTILDTDYRNNYTVPSTLKIDYNDIQGFVNITKIKGFYYINIYIYQFTLNNQEYHMIDIKLPNYVNNDFNLHENVIVNAYDNVERYYFKKDKNSEHLTIERNTVQNYVENEHIPTVIYNSNNYQVIINEFYIRNGWVK